MAGGDIVGGILCLIVHASFLVVAGLFKDFKEKDFQMATPDEDPEVEDKIFKMKVGGGAACGGAIASFLLPLYALFQLIIGGGFIYLYFVRYKKQEGEDDDDRYNRVQAD